MESRSNIKSRHNNGIINNLIARTDWATKVKTWTLNASASTSIIKMSNDRLDRKQDESNKETSNC